MLRTRLEGVPQRLGKGENILRGGSKFRLLPFLGPAFIAAVAYIDPGNFATNIAGGSKYGYLLLWVIVAANLIAMLIQNLSAKVGIATGRSLPELCREHLPRPAAGGRWVQAHPPAVAPAPPDFVGPAKPVHRLSLVLASRGACAPQGGRPGRTAPPRPRGTRQLRWRAAHRRRDHLPFRL